MNDYRIDDVISLPFSTRAFATGVPTALAGTPTVEIYEDAGTTPIVEGAGKLVLTVSLNGVAGFNMATVTLSAANGFESGKHYTLIIKTGTVGGVSVVGEVVAEFTIEFSAAANGVDVVSVSGVASNATNLASACAAYSATRGLAGTALPAAAADAAGGLVISDAGGLDIDGRLDTNIGSRMATYTQPTGFLAATFPTLLPTAGEVRAELDSNSTKLVAIVTHTGTDIPASITALNDVSTTDLATALSDINLDHLLSATSVDADVVTGSVIAKMVADDAAWTTYDPGIGSLQTAGENANTSALLATLSQAEPTTAPAAAETMAEKINYLYAALRNQIDVTATTKTFYNDAGASLWSKALSDDATTYSEAEGA